MAEAFAKVVLENLNSLIQKQFGKLWGVKKEMEKLSSMLSTIIAVLEDAEERQFTDCAIKNWLQKLGDVSFELDDVLDDCEMEASWLEIEGQKHRWTGMVRSSLSCFKPMNTLFRLRIANRTKEIGDRLDQIANERMKFHLREVVGERQGQAIRERRETSSFITQQHVYGREEDKEKVIGFLVDDARNCENISIYPIVGLGGMGKTTLAQLVFNDERVGRHFEFKMWVCVSEDFDVKRLVKAIIESATGRSCEALDMDPLQKCLGDILKWKRFLLVLDDVWNEDHEQWDMLKYVLDCGSNGSSVVVTTRLKKVASIMGTTSIHFLSGLSDDDCWLLFKQRAFGNESEELPNLVKIGKEIVKKCGGVPLAAKALGGLMRFKNEEHEWLSVNQSEIWNLPQDKCSILPALRLSYFHLPIQQRRCFAYCAVFPKDDMIRNESLIHLWMANGLISSKGGLEAMHDLVHDLAQFIMADECGVLMIYKNNSINLPLRLHHLTCNFTDMAPLDEVLDIPCARLCLLHMPPNIGKLTSLRTLSNFIVGRRSGHRLNELHNLSNLGGLLCISNLNKVLPAFRKLSSLKELKIANMSRLPYVDSELYDENLRGFVCLKSLYLIDLPNLEGLTREGGREMFPCLSNFCMDRCPKLTLPCLPSVKLFEVLKPSEVLLKSVPKLDGLTSLLLTVNCDVTSFPNAMLQNLTTLQFLKITGFTKLQEFPAVIQLNNLLVLGISFCHELECLPERVFQSATRLNCFKIRSCKKLKSLSESFCNLTALQSLELDDCPELEGFPDGLNYLYSLQKLRMDHNYGFSVSASHKLATFPEALQHLPSLEFMSVSYFQELRSLPDWLGNLTFLQELELIGCPDFAYIPASIQNLTNLKKLTIESCPELEERCDREVGEDWHKISHVPDVYVGPRNYWETRSRKSFSYELHPMDYDRLRLFLLYETT
ncbi:putative disease resistance protein RGA3 [Morus notabilis]|uniref:putative disease resistance protein RGA3 n=1 Tax=Morus notabilis TaxID=981085 RepID=UPI000CECF188|nr:putative disease resistance protein RGA3 [Morus notabilis]